MSRETIDGWTCVATRQGTKAAGKDGTEVVLSEGLLCVDSSDADQSSYTEIPAAVVRWLLEATTPAGQAEGPSKCVELDVDGATVRVQTAGAGLSAEGAEALRAIVRGAKEYLAKEQPPESTGQDEP